MSLYGTEQRERGYGFCIDPTKAAQNYEEKMNKKLRIIMECHLCSAPGFLNTVGSQNWDGEVIFSQKIFP
jgi:hypothetical protein